MLDGGGKGLLGEREADVHRGRGVALRSGARAVIQCAGPYTGPWA
jgi:hypothetical protein